QRFARQGNVDGGLAVAVDDGGDQSLAAHLPRFARADVLARLGAQFNGFGHGLLSAMVQPKKNDPPRCELSPTDEPGGESPRSWRAVIISIEGGSCKSADKNCVAKPQAARQRFDRAPRSARRRGWIHG